MSRPPRDRSRRKAIQFVGCTGLIATAGCLSFTQTEVCSNEIEFSLTEATESHVSNEYSTPLDMLSYASRTAVSDALEAGTGTLTTRGYYSPTPRTPYVVSGSDTHYFRVSSVGHDRTEVTGYEYEAELGVGESSISEDAGSLAFQELPAHDRLSLNSAIENPGLLHAPHYTNFSVVFAFEDESIRRRSTFVPETDTRFLEWNDTIVRVDFSQRRTVEIASTTVTTELVAENPEAFVKHVGNQRGAEFDSLTDQQRTIVSEASETTYSECEPYSESYSELLDQLSASEGQYVPLVQYDGRWYFVDVSPEGSPRE